MLMNLIGKKDRFPNKILYRGTNKFVDVPSERLYTATYHNRNLLLYQVVANTERFLNLFNIENDPEDTYYVCVSYDRPFTHKFEKNCRKCVDKELCSGYVHGHMYDSNCNKDNCVSNIRNGGTCYGYTQRHIKYDNFGKLHIKNLHKFKCTAHCKCKCNNIRCVINNCRYQMNHEECNCVCDENCTSLETQLGISETADVCDAYDNHDYNINDDDDVIDISKTLIRGIKEELCFNCNCKDVVLYDRNFNHARNNNLFYNAELEIKTDVELDITPKYIRHNKFYYDDYEDYDDDYYNNKSTITELKQKGNIWVKIFGKKDVLINKIEEQFRNKEYRPNDTINAMILVHRENLIKIFPQLFTNHVICKYYEKGCANDKCKHSHLLPNAYDLGFEKYNRKISYR